MKRSCWFILFIIFAFVFQARGANVSVSAPAQVAAGERFRVVFSVDARPSEFQPPSFSDFRVISGPSQSTSSSTQIINNQATTSISVSYTYVLEALNEGTYTIPSARMVVDGRTFTSESKTINVSGQAPSVSPSQPARPSQPAQQDVQQPTSDDIFIRTEISNRNPFQSEQVIVTYKLYTRIGVSRYSIDRLPSYQGFWSENLTSSGQAQPTVEVVNGQQYNVVELRRVALFPQRSGQLRLEPLEVESFVRMRTQRRGGSIFDDFFGGFQDMPYTVRSEAIVLPVKQLPAQNRPASFKGLVGSYNLTVRLQQNELMVNDAANLIVTIEGFGNLRMSEKPDIQFPPNLEVFAPNLSDQIRNERSGVSGNRTYDFTLIPRTTGNFEIPTIQLSYFDPTRGEYVTRSAGPFLLQAGGAAGLDSESPGAIYRTDVQTLTKDIRFIDTSPVRLIPHGKIFYRSKSYYILLIIPVVLFVLALFIGRREIKLRANKALLRTRKAEKLARRRLKSAAAYLGTQDDQKFYDEVFKALWGYISDKLSIPLSRLNKEEVSRIFVTRSLPEDLQNGFLEALNACEFARFAPAAEGNQKQEIFQKAVDTIVRMEKEFRSKQRVVK